MLSIDGEDTAPSISLQRTMVRQCAAGAPVQRGECAQDAACGFAADAIAGRRPADRTCNAYVEPLRPRASPAPGPSLPTFSFASACASRVHVAHSARSPCTRSIHRRPSRDRFFRVTAVPYPELHGLPWAVGRTVAWGGRAALDTRPASPLPARPPLLRCMVGWAQSERARSRVLCSSSGRAGREPCSAGHAALAAPGVNAVATQCARAPKARVHRPGAQGAAAISA